MHHSHPAPNTRLVWSLWEDIAQDYLVRSGYSILFRNWQIRGGELDIIAEFQWKIIFVEVKYRRNPQKSSSRESLTQKKLLRFRRSWELYLMKNDLQDMTYGFDFIAIDREKGFHRITHYPNIGVT